MKSPFLNAQHVSHPQRVLGHLFCGPWAQPHSHAGHAAWLSFALCRRQNRRCANDDLVEAFALLLVATTELLIPAAPPAVHACPSNPQTVEHALSDLADLHDLPHETLLALRSSVRATLRAALHDDAICDRNGTLAPWLVPRLTDALAESSCDSNVDEAALWHDQVPPLSVNVWSPLGALQSLHIDQSPLYVLRMMM